MRHFLNLPIKWKLTVGYSIGVFFLLVVAGTAILAMTTLRDTQSEIQEIHLANVIDYLALDANLNKSRTLLYRMMRSRDPAERETSRRALADASGENDVIMARLAERVAHDPLPQDRFATLKAARDRFNRVRDGQVVPAIMAGREAEAEAAFDASTKHYRETSALAEEMAGLAKDNARSEVEQSITLVRRAMTALAAIAIATLALSAAAIAALNRAIAVPIVAAAGAATRIAEGELDLATPGKERQDEIGELARAFNHMTASLRDLAEIALAATLRGESGLATLAALRQAGWSGKVFFLASAEQAAAEHAAREMGVDSVLRKPFVLDQVSAELGRVMAGDAQT